MQKANKEKIILYVGRVGDYVVDALNKYRKDNPDIKFLLLHNKTEFSRSQKKRRDFFDYHHYCDFDDTSCLQEIISKYEAKLVAATAWSEGNIQFFIKVIPYLPKHLNLPSPTSLFYATNKYLMRRKFRQYDPSITPRYHLVEGNSEDVIKKVSQKVGFPMVVKPSGLDSSRLVTVVYHEDELRQSLKKVFRVINRVYKEADRINVPQVLVEEYMEGKMYSIDAYVDKEGKVIFCPIVYVKTGKDIGFDDFFGYMRLTPTKLSSLNQSSAETVSEKAINALGLRNSSVHIELMRTEEGWKVIELGPRIGGYRHEMYGLSFGINHIANDLLIRMGKAPKVPTKPIGYTAVMQFFPSTEGEITSIKGVRKSKRLDSIVSISINKKIGDLSAFAKHGDKCVISTILFNKSRSSLLADIRRLETNIKIETVN